MHFSHVLAFFFFKLSIATHVCWVACTPPPRSLPLAQALGSSFPTACLPQWLAVTALATRQPPFQQNPHFLPPSQLYLDETEAVAHWGSPSFSLHEVEVLVPLLDFICTA